MGKFKCVRCGKQFKGDGHKIATTSRNEKICLPCVIEVNRKLKQDGFPPYPVKRRAYYLKPEKRGTS